MSSSEENIVSTVDERWRQHYAEASRKRRERGWHRRQSAGPTTRPIPRRFYAAATLVFVALVAIALAWPR